jgi:hypothetical protein
MAYLQRQSQTSSLDKLQHILDNIPPPAALTQALNQVKTQL